MSGRAAIAGAETAIFASLPPRLFLSWSNHLMRRTERRDTGVRSCAHCASPCSCVPCPLARLGRAGACRRAAASRIARSTTWSSTRPRTAPASPASRAAWSMRFNGSPCEGYTVKFRFVTQIETGEKPRRSPISRPRPSRMPTGKNFTFVTKSFTDQNLDHELQAARDARNGRASRSRSKSRKRRARTEATQFPTQHLVELIRKAQ